MANSIPKDWWKNAIVYHIYPRSFCDSNGDGIGDIPGIISKLSYLSDLGVDVIRLSPVFPSPDRANGYDISDYKDIHPDFGTLKDMDKLIAKAKKLGIKIIMDIVINHTSVEHPWFKAALEGDEKYKAYYHFVAGSKKPNNWVAIEGGSAWSKAENGEYYLHLMDSSQPDLNWNNEAVFEELSDVMHFWLKRGVAGFVCDAINIIHKQSYDDGKSRMTMTGKEHYLSTDGCHALIKKFREFVWDEYKPFIVGEAVKTSPKFAKDFCDGSQSEVDSIFFFEQFDVENKGIKWFTKNYKPQKLITSINELQEEIDWPVNHMETQDQIRCVDHFGDVKHYWKESAKLLAGLNLTLKGIPFIYEGQELGMTCGPYKNTMDHSRTPVQWDSTENAGFTTGTPWMKVNENKDYINAVDEELDQDSVLNFYKRLIDLRKNSEALSEGLYRRVASPSDVFVFSRTSLNERMYIYCNMSGESRSVEVYGDNLFLDSYGLEQVEMETLQPYEFRIMKSNF